MKIWITDWEGYDSSGGSALPWSSFEKAVESLNASYRNWKQAAAPNENCWYPQEHNVYSRKEWTPYIQDDNMCPVIYWKDLDGEE